MVDQGNAEVKRSGFSLAGKELNPWLSRRLAKAMTMYKRLPVMMTHRIFPRIVERHPLVLPETRVMTLSRDTGFPDIKGVSTSPSWSKIGLFWVTGRSPSGGLPVAWTNAPGANGQQSASASTVPNFRSISPVSGYARRDTTAVPILPVQTAQGSHTHVLKTGKDGVSTPISSTTKQVSDTIIPPEYTSKPALTEEQTAGPVLPSTYRDPGDKVEFRAAAGHTAESSAVNSDYTNIHNVESITHYVKSKEPPAGRRLSPSGQTSTAEVQTVIPAGQVKPAVSQAGPYTGTSQSAGMRTKPAIVPSRPLTRQPISGTGQAISEDRRPKKTARKFEPVARHFVHAARRPKSAAGITESVPGNSKSADRQAKPYRQPAPTITGYSSDVFEPSVPSAGKTSPPAGQTMVDAREIATAGRPTEAIARPAPSRQTVPEQALPAGEPIQSITGYSGLEWQSGESRRVSPGQTGYTPENYKPVNLAPVSLSPSGSYQTAYKTAGVSNLPEMLHAIKPLPLSSPDMGNSKKVASVVRPMTRRSEFQSQHDSLPIPETSGSIGQKASSGDKLPLSRKVQERLVPGSGVKSPRSILYSDMSKGAASTSIYKNDSTAKDLMDQSSESNAQAVSNRAAVDDSGPLISTQREIAGLQDEMPGREKTFTGLKQTRRNRVNNEQPVIRPSIGGKQANSRPAPDFRSQPAIISSPRSLQFAAEITRATRQQPELNIQGIQQDNYPAVIKPLPATSNNHSHNQSPLFTSTGSPPGFTQEPTGAAGRATENKRSEVLRDSPWQEPIPELSIVPPVPQQRRYSGQISTATSNQRKLNNLKTEQTVETFPAVPETATYPESGKPAGLTRLYLPVAAAGHSATYHETASATLPFRAASGQAPVNARSVERPAAPMTFMPPRAQQEHLQAQEMGHGSGVEQNTAKTDLKALAREVYPFIKHMIMVDRERLPL